jgi:hypothetical protein
MTRRIIARLGYLYLLRVPIVTALLLVLFPLLAVKSGSLTALLENLFQLGWRGTFWTALTAVLTAWSVMLTGTLVLVNGRSRLGVPAVFKVKALQPWMSIVAVALAVPVMVAQFLRAGDFGYGAKDIVPRIGAVLSGVAAAYSMAYVAMLVAVWLAPAGTQADSLQAFPAPGFLRKWLRTADAKAPWVAGLISRLGRKLKTFPRALWAGYLDPATGSPWSGHWLASAFGAVTFAFYETLNLVAWRQLKWPGFPAVMFVLWAFLCANWLLGFMAFFLDRFRIPLLAPLVLAGLLASRNSQSDHYFQFQEAEPHPLISPADVLNARAGANPIIVVATAGGGIQAAVWTAQVLSGLQMDSLGLNPGSVKWPADFAGSLAMVSSVSGGATGAMFFLNRYRDGANPGFRAAPEDLHGIVDQAALSSLDDVAWALVDHDIPRLYFPYSLSLDDRFIDRGKMLERNWQTAGHIYSHLADWRKGVVKCAACRRAAAWRPATIFNAMIAESGRPLLLGTTDLKVKDGQPGPWSFYDWFPKGDIPIVTAVRLAATFPYVSPAARPYTAKPELHVVDGGYYDNYGVETLVDWLSEGLEAWGRKVDEMPRILVIQIRSFPNDAEPQPSPKSAAFQLYAPLEGLLNVRNTAQVIRDANSLEHLQDRWMRSDRTPVVQVATLQFGGTNAPLSWAINSRQRKEVATQWCQILGGQPDAQSSCAPGQTDPEKDLQLVRCVMQESTTPACTNLMKNKRPW